MIYRDDDISYKTSLGEFKLVHNLFIKYGVIHTIALITENIDKNPELVQYIKENDIDVQLHCFEHLDSTLNTSILKEQLQKGINIIEKQFGKRPTTFYPPWNKVNIEVIHIATELNLEVSFNKISLSQYIRKEGKVSESTINFHYWSKEDFDLLEKALIITTNKLYPKIAIISANIGGIDNEQSIVPQTIPFDYYYITENNLPFPLPNLDNRLKSKYCKIMTHKFLPEYDIYIWLDGRVNITSPLFVEKFISNLNEQDITIMKHEVRDNIYSEMEFIISLMKKGNPYLLDRYKNQQMEEELKFYIKEQVPENLPLFACGIFARLNNDKVNLIFNEWWNRILEFSYFDQTMFSYVAWKKDLDIHPLLWKDFVGVGKLISLEKHKI